MDDLGFLLVGGMAMEAVACVLEAIEVEMGGGEADILRLSDGGGEADGSMTTEAGRQEPPTDGMTRVQRLWKG